MPASPILIGRSSKQDVVLRPGMANRHGLIAGATGTGKTVTLQVLAEAFSERGIPVFLADVKGDLSGVSQPGSLNPKIEERLRALGLGEFSPTGWPVTFWDVAGAQGHRVRATISDMGPLLLSRLLQLNDTQTGVLNIVFRVADEHGLLLLDMKDLRALLAYVADNASAFTSRYGNISRASVGAIQRGLMTLEQQGGERFFGEPALNLEDLIQTDGAGRGVINILAANQLMNAPRLYATLLLWLLSELFENLPEIGDPPQPKLVFFFDEAHLLFAEAPRALLEKIELVVRLIRSKGVGVYFVTQNPTDIPESVLGQLGNRIQHALRAFTPNDRQAVRAAARTFRANPEVDTETALTELGVGEALISVLDERGQPTPVERALIAPPRSQIGPISNEQRQIILRQSLVAGVYDQDIDRESAYERLNQAHPAAAPQAGPSAPAPLPKAGPSQSGGRRGDSLFETMTKSVLRTAGSTIGREIVRGMLGSIFGGRRKK